jgi:hypothetical protein
LTSGTAAEICSFLATAGDTEIGDTTTLLQVSPPLGSAGNTTIALSVSSTLLVVLPTPAAFAPMSDSLTPPWIPETKEEMQFFDLQPSIPVQFRATNVLNDSDEFDVRQAVYPKDSGASEPGHTITLQYPTWEQTKWRYLSRRSFLKQQGMDIEDNEIQDNEIQDSSSFTDQNTLPHSEPPKKKARNRKPLNRPATLNAASIDSTALDEDFSIVLESDASTSEGVGPLSTQLLNEGVHSSRVPLFTVIPDDLFSVDPSVDSKSFHSCTC